MRQGCVAAIIVVVAVHCSAEVPAFANFLSWRPHYPTLRADPFDEVSQILDPIHAYADGGKVEGMDCTFAALRQWLWNGVGLFLLDSHGDRNGIRLCMWAADKYPDAQLKRDTLLLTYRALYPDYADSFAAENWPQLNPKLYGIAIASRVSNALSAVGHGGVRQGMLFDSACEDGANAYGFLYSTVAFAYPNETTSREGRADIRGILSRMWGRASDSHMRYAYCAWKDYGQPRVQIYPTEGTPGLELCPVVSFCSVAGPDEEHPRRGGIVVGFSAPVEGDPDAFVLLEDKENVEWQERSDDGMSGSPHWVAGSNQKWVKCCYNVKGKGGTYTIRIVGSLVKARTRVGDLFLDGNGVAPNKDDYVISLKVRDCGL